MESSGNVAAKRKRDAEDGDASRQTKQDRRAKRTQAKRAKRASEGAASPEAHKKRKTEQSKQDGVIDLTADDSMIAAEDTQEYESPEIKVQPPTQQPVQTQPQSQTKKRRKTAAEMWNTQDLEEPVIDVPVVQEQQSVATAPSSKPPLHKQQEVKTKGKPSPKKEVISDGSTNAAHAEPKVVRKSKKEVVGGEDADKKPKKMSTAEKRKARDTQAGADTRLTETASKQKKGKESRTWALSDSMGGRFIESDPVFTSDEKYLVLATETALNVYTTEDSLLAHSLQSGVHGRITAFTLSPSRPNVLWMATDKGHIVQWDFEEEKVVGMWKTDATIHEIHATIALDEANDILYTIDRSRGWSITTHRIGINGDLSKTELATLLNHEMPMRSLRVYDQGRILILLTLEGFMVGIRSWPKGTPFDGQKYAWREIKTTEAPVCLAAHIDSTVNSKKPIINLAIGSVIGRIFVYLDIYNDLRPAVSRELHWHREEVGALAWSLDGNYIISGGRETVLVLWQLETGLQQFLPHLESPIESIVVSPTGTSYGVHLADNSVMVLSTSELTPVTNFAGLQSIAASSIVTPQPKIETVAAQTQKEIESKTSAVTVINPNDHSQMLLVVPSSQSGPQSAQYAAAPYLQMYDVNNARHLSRQALTRTNATDTNLGPKGERIQEPDVKFMQITPNGKWLAIVEEWAVAPSQVRDLTVDEDVADESERLFDTKLKIWAWHERDQVWMLNSRIEAPHAQADSSMRILDLVVDPSGSRFATIGADSTVKLWTPKSKSSTGRTIKGEAQNTRSNAAEPETWWALDLVIPLESSYQEDPLEMLIPQRASLAFSEDGTVLAAYEFFGEKHDQGLVHFIDPERGCVSASRGSLHTGFDGIQQMAFFERNLVCLGRAKAFVWDITNFDLKAQLVVDKTAKSKSNGQKRSINDTLRLPRPIIAVDHVSSTFAIAAASEAREKKTRHEALLDYRTQVYIFSARGDFQRIQKFNLPRLALSLLSASGVGQASADDSSLNDIKGYIVLDTAAEIRKLSPLVAGSTALSNRTAVADTPASFGSEVPQVIEQPEPMEVDDAEEAVEEGQTLSTALTQDEDDRPVVRKEDLGKVFDHYQSHAMPSLKDMFSNVLKLFARR